MRPALTMLFLALFAAGTNEARADALPPPPPDAFSACTGKTLAADCAVSSLDKVLDGLCVIEGQDHLYCLPYELSLPPEGYLN